MSVVATAIDSTGDTTNAPALTGGFAEKSRKKAKKTHDRKSDTVTSTAVGALDNKDHSAAITPVVLIGNAANHVSHESNNRHVVIDESMPDMQPREIQHHKISEPTASTRSQSSAPRKPVAPQQPSYKREFTSNNIVYEYDNNINGNDDDDNDDNTSNSTIFHGSSDVRDISILSRTPKASYSNGASQRKSTITIESAPEETETSPQQPACTHCKIFICYAKDDADFKKGSIICATSVAHAQAMMNKRILLRDPNDNIDQYTIVELDSNKPTVQMFNTLGESKPIANEK